MQEVGQRRQRGRSGDRLSGGMGGRCSDLVSNDKGKRTQNIGLGVRMPRTCTRRKGVAFP